MSRLFYALIIRNMKKRTIRKVVCISVRMEVVRRTKVRAYTRIRNGKIEKVKSHYRRY